MANEQSAKQTFANLREEDSTGDRAPLVSVCIPTYNGAKYLPSAIQSVLTQSFRNFELVVVDNHSTDDTREIVKSFADPRIRYICHERTISLEDNWNFCVGAAKGRYFKLLPHDDLLEPECLNEQVAILEADNRQEISLVFGSRRVIDDQGRRLLARGRLAHKRQRMDGQALIRRSIRAGTNLIGEPGNGLVRSSVVARTGGYSTRHPYMTDFDFWLRVLQHGDAYFTATPTSSFRVTLGSWSAAIGRAQYLDFRNFVSQVAADPRLGITATDRFIGLTMARINTMARLLIYRVIDLRR